MSDPQPSTDPPAVYPGPAVLGRGVVIAPHAQAPDDWTGAPHLVIDNTVLAEPRSLLETLHLYWAQRQPVVVELRCDNVELREPELTDARPHDLSFDFEFARERLYFLVWANNYDARNGLPRWWWGVKAIRLGGAPSDTHDMVLPSGRHAWVDGGPRSLLSLADPVVHRESIERGQLVVARSKSVIDEDLADDQAKAAGHNGGPARVIAPAGSGKTRVLTARLEFLIKSLGWERDVISAVAYNKRAAEELKERTEHLNAQVRTIHSLGNKILGAVREFDLIEDWQVRNLFSPLVNVRPISGQDLLRPYLDALTHVRLNLVQPELVEETSTNDIPGFAEAFYRYRDLLKTQRKADFDEQIYGAIEVLLQEPGVRRTYQEQCRHLLVDEFQDLTPAYMLLLRLLSAPTLDVFGVGDDDQVIYGYAGANPDFLIHFSQYFPHAASYALGTNYRSPVAVVDATKSLLAHNTRRIHKDIDPTPGRAQNASELRVIRGEVSELAHKLIELIRAWHSRGVRSQDIVTLTRTNNSLLPVQVALILAGIPCKAVFGPEVLERRTGIRTALAYIRLASSPEMMRNDSIVDAMRRPSRKISNRVTEKLEQKPTWARAELGGLDITDWDRSRFQDFLTDMDGLTKKVEGGATTIEVLRSIRVDVGLGKAMTALDKSGELDSPHLDDLLALEQVAGLHDDPATFEAWLSGRLAERAAGPEVHLSTVHKVKGLEWDRVVIFGASVDQFPHKLAPDLEEERRIFHVAITRGRSEVVALADRSAPSPFIKEMADETTP